MPQRFRKNWSHHVDEVIRSRHYNWLGYGLGGDPVEQAMSTLAADIMHICKRRGIRWQAVLERGREQFEKEEAELNEPANQHPVSPRPRPLSKRQGDRVSTHACLKG